MKLENILLTAIVAGSVLACILIPALLIAPVRALLLQIIGLKAIASLLCFSLFSVLVVLYSVIYNEN